MVITKDGLMVTSRRVYGQGWGHGHILEAGRVYFLAWLVPK